MIKKGAHKISRLKILLALSLYIFTVEATILFLLPEDFPKSVDVLIDGVVLVLFLFPIMYLFVVRPGFLQVESKAQLMGEILDRSVNEIYTFDSENLHFVEVSQGALDHLGYSPEEIKELTPLDLKPEYDFEQFNALIGPLKSGGQKRIVFETVHKCKDGTLYPVEVRLMLSEESNPPVFVAIIMDISERKRYMEELEHKALYDSLTDLPNRLLLQDRLKHGLRIAQRNSNSLVVLIVEVLHLRDVNSVMGFHSGDLVLQELADRFRKCFRASDTISRMEGPEFALVFSVSDIKHASILADKVLDVFRQPFMIEETSIEIEGVAGISLYPDHGEETDILLQRAGVAVNAARHEPSGFSIYTSEEDPYSLRKLKLFGELRQAIEQKDLSLYYQPQVDIASRKVVGVEALARWQHLTEGMIPPNDFIPIAEQSGLIRPFTVWVLEEAIEQLKNWLQSGIYISVSINLSTRNLLDPNLVSVVDNIARTKKVDPNCITLEITESAIMSRPEKAMEVLTQLNNMGFNLSIDDFGTGYSSLAYLRKLPVQEIKIDRSFVTSLTENDDDAAIVNSTIALAKNMGLFVVAEGVEDEKALNRLQEMHCDIAQGYYMCRPVPAEELEEWLQNSPWGLKKEVNKIRQN